MMVGKWDRIEELEHKAVVYPEEKRSFREYMPAKIHAGPVKVFGYIEYHEGTSKFYFWDQRGECVATFRSSSIKDVDGMDIYV